MRVQRRHASAGSSRRTDGREECINSIGIGQNMTTVDERRKEGEFLASLLDEW